MIIYQKRIYREDLRANPDVFYVFGDNLLRVGMSGQAGEMRGEPNAIGIATKKSPGVFDRDYFSDFEYDSNVESIFRDLGPLREILIVPADGIGTGLSEMPMRCPKTFEFLCSLGLGGVAYT